MSLLTAVALGEIGPYYPSMAQVRCECGAVYERKIDKVPFRDNDSFNCQVCGVEMESWNSSVIPYFELISKPDKGGSDDA